jgi:hypothetical protein
MVIHKNAVIKYITSELTKHNICFIISDKMYKDSLNNGSVKRQQLASQEKKFHLKMARTGRNMS